MRYEEVVSAPDVMEDRIVGGLRRKLYSIFSDTGQLLGWFQASKFSAMRFLTILNCSFVFKGEKFFNEPVQKLENVSKKKLTNFIVHVRI